MWLPVELPLDLQQAGVPVESSGTGLAWSSGVAKAIVEALSSSTVAIVAGEIFRSDRVGLVPLYSGWVVERHPGELATDFAARSRQVARMKIDAQAQAGTGSEFYAFTFSSQQDAA
jgi:hypothetical protein